MRRMVAVSIVVAMGVFAACGDPESQGSTQVTQQTEDRPAPSGSVAPAPSEATTAPIDDPAPTTEISVDSEPAGTSADVGAPGLAEAVAAQRVGLCGGLGAELPEGAPTFEALVSSGGVTLVSVLCELFAYQGTHALAGWDGAELSPMQVEQWSRGALVDDPLILGYPFVEEDGTVANLEKARGIGDCGQYQSWEFTGTMVLLEARVRSCDVEGDYTAPETWDLVYPSDGAEPPRNPGGVYGDYGVYERVSFPAGSSGTTISDAVAQGTVNGYLLEAGAGQLMTVTITSQHADFTAMFEVYAPDDTRLPAEGSVEDSEALTSSASFTLPADGEYLVVVSAERGGSPYVLEFEITSADPFRADVCVDEGTALDLARTEYPELNAVTIDLCKGPIAVGTGFLASGDAISVAFVENGSWQFLAGSFGFRSICEAVWAIDPLMDIGCGVTDATGWMWPYSTYFEVPQLGEEPVRGSGCGVSGQLGDTIPDGVWNGYVQGLTATTLLFDVACVYYGDIAEDLIDEHLATIPEDEILGDFNPSYWIVNTSERVREVPVAWDFASRAAVWTDYGCEDPGPGEDDYLPTGWFDSWLIIENGEAVFLLESCHYG